MKGEPTPRDPFRDPAPQVSNVYRGEEPPDLRNFDDAKGGIDQAQEQADPHSRSFFQHEPEHSREFDFTRKGAVIRERTSKP
jgi:hypothetical protein